MNLIIGKDRTSSKLKGFWIVSPLHSTGTWQDLLSEPLSPSSDQDDEPEDITTFKFELHMAVKMGYLEICRDMTNYDSTKQNTINVLSRGGKEIDSQLRITLTNPVWDTPMSVMITRHFISCSLAYSYCSVRLGSGTGTSSAWCMGMTNEYEAMKRVQKTIFHHIKLKNKVLSPTLIFSSHNSATSSMRSINRPPPPLEQTRMLVVASFLQQWTQKVMTQE